MMKNLSKWAGEQEICRCGDRPLLAYAVAHPRVVLDLSSGVIPFAETEKRQQNQAG